MFYIFGDIHIGDKRSDDSLNLLHKTLSGLDKKGTIILNGDCIDFIRCDKLDQRHFKFFDVIGKFSNVIYIIGNHDYNAREKLKDRGFLFVDEFALNDGYKKIKILHGNQADFFARKWPIISKVVIGINSFIYDITSLDIERQIKRIEFFRKLFFNKQENKLINKYKKDFDCLISGHTHHCIYKEQELDDRKFLYMNCGDWIDNCAYGIINNGEITLMQLQ